jgi:hypothetical protein
MNLPPPEICQRMLALWILIGAPDWKEEDRVRLLQLLAKHGQTANDLPAIFRAAGVAAAPSLSKDKERIWRLFGQLNSDNEPTRTTARKKLDLLLDKKGLTWNGPNGFTAILVAYWADNNVSGTTRPQQTTDDELRFSALDFLLALLEDYHVMSPMHRMIVALWSLHTYVYDQFEVTPRLFFISPTSGYGKTRLLQLLEQVVCEPKLSKNTTAAAIYRRLARKPRTTYLLDEAENQGILTDRVMRAVIDGGFEGGGTVDRADGEFAIHFPCVAAIRGQMHDLPLAILSRSLPIAMMKGTPRKRFNRKDPGPAFSVARALNQKWKAIVSLDSDPEMPAVLTRDSREADNCRPLISIADAFGEANGTEARAALVELCADLPSQDPALTALNACKAVFDAAAPEVDRIEGKVLAKAVVDKDDYFNDWRGVNDQGLPHVLTSGELSRLLKRFGVRSRSMRLPGGRWGRGYMRAWIDSAWRSQHVTATQPRKILALARS